MRRKLARGYERLAFGSIQDAVKLLFCEELDPEWLSGLDLFPVSEIKRPKGGGMEIKFVDRLKAMERLEELGGADPGGEPLLRALDEGARALWEEGRGGVENL